MAVLVMDTSTDVLVVGAKGNHEEFAHAAVRVPRGHSRLLQPTLKSAMEQASTTVSDIELFGVGVGPGSYTGVRLGVTTAKVMALTAGKPVVAVSTLAMMAEAAIPGHVRETIVIPLLFARRQRAFGAVYTKRGRELMLLQPERVRPVAEWMDYVRNVDRAAALVAVHDFLPAHQVLSELDGAAWQACMHLHEVAGNLPASLLHLTERKFGTVVDGSQLHGLVPEYGLEVEAEVKLRERREATHGS